MNQLNHYDPDQTVTKDESINTTCNHAATHVHFNELGLFLTSIPYESKEKTVVLGTRNVGQAF